MEERLDVSNLSSLSPRSSILWDAKLIGRIVMDERVEINHINRANNGVLHKSAVWFTAIHTFARLA
jgi:hypothetical protein